MATIQRSTTKVANKLVSYAEKRAEIKGGVNLQEQYAKAQMKATRELWGKNDGIQAHHVIQSFRPDEVSPEKANQIGQELAEQIAPGHEAAVYTHTDKDHVHNHIVVNSVNFEDGRKYHAHGKQELYNIREVSDQLCQKHELSVVREKTAEMRHTLAEQNLIKKGKSSWKDEIRQAIDATKNRTADFNSFKEQLEQDYGIQTKLRGQTLSFKHPDQQRYVRAKKLGANYEMEGLRDGFERQIRARSEHDRTVSGNQEAQRDDDQLYQRSYERGNEQEQRALHAAGADSSQIERGHEQHGVDLEQAREVVKTKRRKLARDIDQWTRSNSKEQQQDHPGSARDSKNKQRSAERDEQRDNVEHQKYGEEEQRSRQKSKTRSDELSL